MVKAYQKTIKSDEQAVVYDFAAMLALNNGKDATLYFEDTMFAGKILFMQVKPKKVQKLEQILTDSIFKDDEDEWK